MNFYSKSNLVLHYRNANGRHIARRFRTGKGLVRFCRSAEVASIIAVTE